jgi:hypothetical protein
MSVTLPLGGYRGALRHHALAFAFAGLFALWGIAPHAAANDVLTQRYNAERTGSTIQPGLSQSTLRDPRWRELGRLRVNGVVYAQPLYVENIQIAGRPQPLNIVFVATGTNEVSAFDANTSQRIWNVPLGSNDKSTIPNVTACNFISLPGGIGIESTPVIDRARGVIYISYRTNPSSTDSLKAEQRLRMLDIRTGQQLNDVQVLPPGAPGDWTVWHRSRAGLLLNNGIVYIGIASRCEDVGHEFHGWVLAYDAATLRPVGAYSPTADVSGKAFDGGGIWQGAVGLAADSAGAIYATTGNRRVGVDRLPAEAPNQADSFVKLVPTITRSHDGSVVKVDLNLTDWFTPYRRVWLDDQDLDLAAAGPVLIPETNLLLGGGKSGIIYVLDSNKMGKLDEGHAWTAADLAKIPVDAVDTEWPEDFAADAVVQKFQGAFNQYVPRGSPYLPRAGAPVATAIQNRNQTDVFAVGRDGAIHVYWSGDLGPWTDGTSGRSGPAPISPSGLAPTQAHLATAPQGPNQLDTFVVGNDGAVYVTWVVGGGHWADGTPGNPGPASITPRGLAPAGAPIATAMQGSNQLDTFVVGNDGAIHVTWVFGGGHWADGSPGNSAPAQITPTGLAPAGAFVAAAPQGPNQLDAFVVGNDGAIHVTWVVGGGHWADGTPGNPGPATITPGNLAPAGASVAAASQGSNQLDAFVVGNDGAAYVTWVVDGGHWADGTPGNPGPVRITPVGEAPAGACLSAAHQNDHQLDVFYVANDGAIHVTWVVDLGHWADGTPGNPPPARITPLTPPGLVKPGSCVAVIKRPEGNQMDAFVTGDDGSLWLTWEDNDGRWHDDLGNPAFAPSKLTQAIWMRRCWWCWPHIHGSPVYAAFPNNARMLYVWPEKDHLKAWPWVGDRVDHGHPILGTDRSGALVLAPPGPPFGMPGGMLAVSIDPGSPNTGVLFASVARADDQMKGMLRAFDPLTLKELWNNAGTDYMFMKFVPPTIAGGRVFLPTGSDAVIVYGLL